MREVALAIGQQRVDVVAADATHHVGEARANLIGFPRAEPGQEVG